MRARRKRRRPGDDPDGVVHVFTREGDRPRSTADYLRDMWARRAVVSAMAHAESRAAHAQATLGGWWSVFDPAFSALIYIGLFTVLRHGGTGRQITPIIAGTFLFSVTQTVLAEGARSIRSSRGLLLNSTFPRATLLLVPLHKAVLRLRYSVPVYVVLHVLFHGPVGIGLALLPLLLDVQLALSLGIALLLATVATLHRDSERLIGYLLRLLLFTAPVMFAPDTLPDSARFVMYVNPFFGLFAAYRDAIGGRIPATADVAEAFAWAGFFVVVGFITFRRHEHRLANHVV